MEPSRNKAICLPFGSEEEYRELVKDGGAYREHLEGVFPDLGELFPKGFAEGFHLHDVRHCKKLDLDLRRVKVKATGKVYLVRPSLMMPYGVGYTDDLAKALFLRRWGVPFEALAEVFGGHAKLYERAWLSLGRHSIVGTTIKDPSRLPKDLVADEKHSRLLGEKVYVTNVVAQGCFLGAAVVEDAGKDALERGYGEFAQEARELDPEYRPESVCLDGWSATRKAWLSLFPTIVVVLCFLHSALKVGRSFLKSEAWRRYPVMKQVWRVYHSATARSFAQRIRRLKEWTDRLPQNAWPLKQALLKLCNKAPLFMPSFQHKHAHRTSNMVDRLISYQDRLLFAQRYFHGNFKTARLALRAQALLWNFHPYSKRMRRDQPTRLSPFHDINGFQYHGNWLHNLLCAASMGGRKR